MTTKTYSELIKLPTFADRFRYLKMSGAVGEQTFGYERWLNQKFYRSYEWKQVRNKVILRDQAMDLGCEGHELPGRIIIHHMNPINTQDILDVTEILLNPEYLISTCHQTHNAIHFGDESILANKEPIVRKPGDTKLW